MKAVTDSQGLAPFDWRDLNVVIDTPKGSRSKFKYEEGTGLYKLVRVLPTGAVFPFNFGFLPATLGGDGDPLDALLLMEEPLFPGCMVSARLIGVIGATQTAGETTVRNDRLITVAHQSILYDKINSLDEIGETLGQIEDFFIAYNASFGREFVPLNRGDAEIAAVTIHAGMEAFKNTK